MLNTSYTPSHALTRNAFSFRLNASRVNIHRMESTFYYFCFFLFLFLFSFSSCHFYENNMFRFHLLKSCLLFFHQRLHFLVCLFLLGMKSVKCITHNLKHTFVNFLHLHLCVLHRFSTWYEFVSSYHGNKINLLKMGIQCNFRQIILCRLSEWRSYVFQLSLRIIVTSFVWVIKIDQDTIN